MRLPGFLALSIPLILSSGCAYSCTFKSTPSGQNQHASSGVEVYLHPDLKQYAPFSHACKMSDGKRSIAVLGTYTGTVFVDYTDDKIEEGDIKFFGGPKSDWRECRSYNDKKSGNVYAYVVTEGSKRKMVDGKMDFDGYPGGIQIFKMTSNSVEHVSTYVGNFHTAHTIVIDNEHGAAFVNGSRWREEVPAEHKDHTDHLGGLRILDIGTDPENPRDIGGYNASYTHDSYFLGEADLPKRTVYEDGKYVERLPKKGQVLYLADIYGGYIHAIDVSDTENPRLESSTHTPLHNQGIATHNVWASEDKKWLFATEETEGSSLLVYDISDPVKPRFVTAYRSELVAKNSIIHNVVVKGNVAYCSWYKDGVRLVDISNPANPKEIAFFDSSVREFSQNDPFHGNWSVDVDDRGLIIISDIEEGLFILKRTN